MLTVLIEHFLIARVIEHFLIRQNTLLIQHFLPIRPSFTLTSPRIQPHAETREKQLEAWATLVITYADAAKIDAMTVSEATLSPLFVNAALKRKCLYGGKGSRVNEEGDVCC